MPPRVKQRSALSERLLKLHTETNLPEACELPNGVVIQPLTRTRMQGLHDAELKKYFLQQTLAHRIGLLQSPPKLPEAATEEQTAQYVSDLAKFEKLPEDIDELSKQISRADDDWYKAFFGESCSAVLDFFEDKPELWEEFMPDIKAEFLPATPDTGVCATCGHVNDEEAAGKAPESST
jgi:hypothetical protein